MDEDMKQEEKVEEEKESNSLLSEIFGYGVAILILVTVAFGISNCSLKRELEEVREAQEISLEEVSDGSWYANCYRWNKEGGIDFACYDEDVWDAPCMMSFRMLESTPDTHGDISTLMLEVREVCPSN
jgi:hypothetical protein